MSTITTRDGTEIHYKNRGSVQPVAETVFSWCGAFWRVELNVTAMFLNRVPRAPIYVRYRTDCGQFCNYNAFRI